MQNCPRCGDALPDNTYLDKLNESPGRHAAYRLRHKKANGKMCVAYVGPEYLMVLPSRPHRALTPEQALYAVGH